MEPNPRHARPAIRLANALLTFAGSSGRPVVATKTRPVSTQRSPGCRRPLVLAPAMLPERLDAGAGSATHRIDPLSSPDPAAARLRHAATPGAHGSRPDPGRRPATTGREPHPDVVPSSGQVRTAPPDDDVEKSPRTGGPSTADHGRNPRLVRIAPAADSARRSRPAAHHSPHPERSPQQPMHRLHGASARTSRQHSGGVSAQRQLRESAGHSSAASDQLDAAPQLRRVPPSTIPTLPTALTDALQPLKSSTHIGRLSRLSRKRPNSGTRYIRIRYS